MNTEALSEAVPDPPSEQPSRRSRTRRIARGLFLYAFIPYVAVLAVFAAFQRSLIYQRTRVAALECSAAGFLSGQAHDVSVTTHDGLRLNGWHVLPNGLTADSPEEGRELLARASAVVLMFPGNAGSRLDRCHALRDFTELGMHAFLFDYRGYGDNPGTPSEKALIRDAQSIWQFLTRDCGVPPGRIILVGESLGGGVAVQLAAETCQSGETPGAILLMSSFSSLSDVAAWHFPCFPVRPLLVDRFDSCSRIGSVTGPIVIIHGTEDEIVPFELGRKLFAAAPDKSAGGIHKQFVEVPRGLHNDYPRAQIQENLRKLMKLVRETVPQAS